MGHVPALMEKCKGAGMVDDIGGQWGAILQISQTLAVVIGGGFGIYRIGRNTQKTESAITRANEVALEQKAEMGELKLEVRKLSDVLTTMAVTTTRVDNLAATITELRQLVNDLRRGEGFIFPLGAHVPGSRSG
jgi:hypothetical protein